MSTATDAYRAARDHLLGLRGQQARAVGEFRWPDVGERFNWAIDWFDAIARGTGGAVARGAAGDEQFPDLLA